MDVICERTPIHSFFIAFSFFSHLILKQITINNVSLQTQQRNIAIMDHHGVEQQEQHENNSTTEATSKYIYFCFKKMEIE